MLTLKCKIRQKVFIDTDSCQNLPASFSLFHTNWIYYWNLSVFLINLFLHSFCFINPFVFITFLSFFLPFLLIYQSIQSHIPWIVCKFLRYPLSYSLSMKPSLLCEFTKELQTKKQGILSSKLSRLLKPFHLQLYHELTSHHCATFYRSLSASSQSQCIEILLRIANLAYFLFEVIKITWPCQKNFPGKSWHYIWSGKAHSTSVQ